MSRRDPLSGTAAAFFLPVLLAALLLAVGRGPAAAACNPCTTSYAIEVRHDGSQPAVLTGTAAVNDGALDADQGSLQALLAQQLGGNPVLEEVTAIHLDGSPGLGRGDSDVLLARHGEVIAWVDAPIGAAAHLHLTTLLSQAQAHPFGYMLSARGTESPPVSFQYLLTANGDETYRSSAEARKSISIGYFLPPTKLGFREAKCEERSGTVCLRPGCKRTGVRIDQGTAVRVLDQKIDGVGEECADYYVRVSSTSTLKKTCEGAFYDCAGCGAWYEGTAVLDGYCDDTRRPWSRSLSGSGQVEAKPDTDFTVGYAAAGGPLGSGGADMLAALGATSYSAVLSGCNVGGNPVSCGELGTTVSGDTLLVSTTYVSPVAVSKNGNAALSGTQGIVLIDALPFSTENGDVRHDVEVSSGARTYRDVNADGYVDVGPFAVWIAGPGDDQLWATFDRSGFPVAKIDSLQPNPALVGESVNLEGHGEGAFSGFQWFTHRQDQPGGTLLGSAASITRNDLKPGVHQVRFQALGNRPSPFVFGTLAVNQPPVAILNHVENSVDPSHPSVALLLRDGVAADAFELDGSGFDVDGTVTAYEWSSDHEPGAVIGTAAHIQRSLTALGQHTIALRVRDDRGVWSAPVTTSVTVRRPPVLLVHGFCGGIASWDELVNHSWLEPDWPNGDVLRRTYDPDGDGRTNDSPAAMAVLLRQEIQAAKQRYGVRTVDLLAHSLGGLTSRAYVQGPGYQGDVNKLVMLGTPNHGSTVADLTLISNGYSPADLELVIPSAAAITALRVLGIFVDVIDAFDLWEFAACRGQDSDALQALRPHSQFLRRLNGNRKDDGTEDFGSSGEPADAVSPYSEYFTVHGNRLTISHTHLPEDIVDAIRLSTLGAVDLTGLSLLWARDGDTVVTGLSNRLDGVPATAFDRKHVPLRTTEAPVRQARDYLLDDPPPPPRGDAPRQVLLTAQPMGAARGRLTEAEQVSAAEVVEVDGATEQLRLGLSWDVAPVAALTQTTATTRVREWRPVLVLTSPKGERFESATPRETFAVKAGATSLEAIVERPEPGAWSVEVRGSAVENATTGSTTGRRGDQLEVGRRPGIDYAWFAFAESATFLALGLSADAVSLGQPVTIAAYLRDREVGVVAADVQAAVGNGKSELVSLKLEPDARVAGLYTAIFTPLEEGVYRLYAVATVPLASGSSVTRVGVHTFESRLLPDVAVSLIAAPTSPSHHQLVRLVARVENRGKAPATTIPVRLFDGHPASGGRLLVERTVTVPPAAATPGAVTVSVPWVAVAGAHRIVAVVDPEGLSGESSLADNVAEVPLDVTDGQPPLARAGADQLAAAGQNLVFDGRGSSDDDRIVDYRWQPAATGTRLTRPAFSLTGGHAVLVGGFPQPGSYTVRLTVTDASGNRSSDDLVVTVVSDFDGQAAHAAAGADVNTIVRLPVKFDGSGSSDNFGVALATWDVDLARDSDGDGNPSNDRDLAGLAPTLERGYEYPGTYHVRLAVSDAVGNPVATDEMVVRVRAAAACTLTVPPGADVGAALGLSSRGDTVCLLPAIYSTTVVVARADVTLDGQGAILERPDRVDPELPAVAIRLPGDEAGAVTVRRLTIRGFRTGFAVVAPGLHTLVDNRVEDAVTGYSITANQAVLEGNSAVRCNQGFVLGGAQAQLRGNSATAGGRGFVLGSGRHHLERNRACGNSLADILATRTRGGNSSGQDNTCDRAANFADDGLSGCATKCDQGTVAGDPQRTE
jgi:hypothetical protein